MFDKRFRAEIGKVKVGNEKKIIKTEVSIKRKMSGSDRSVIIDWPFFPQDLDPAAVKQVRMHQEVILPMVVLDDEESLPDNTKD